MIDDNISQGRLPEVMARHVERGLLPGLVTLVAQRGSVQALAMCLNVGDRLGAELAFHERDDGVFLQTTQPPIHKPGISFRATSKFFNDHQPMHDNRQPSSF